MYENLFSLNNLAPGKKAVVKYIETTGIMRRRLHDLGIVDGTVIECVLTAPGKDPSAYLVRGALIALRNENSSKILVGAI
jgi:ferrous iron transport protein A